MKKLLTIIPFYVFTAAFGQITSRITSVQADTIVAKIIYFNGYPIKGATNLWGPGTYLNNNTLFTASGLDWLMSNHPTILKLRSDLDAVGTGAVTDPKLRQDLNTVMAENVKLKTDIADLKAIVAVQSDYLAAHDSAIMRLQTDSTLMTIVNTGTIAKPVWKITTLRPTQ